MKSRKTYLLSFGGWFSSASPILEASTTMITPTFDFVALLPQFLHDQLQLWGWLFGRDMLRISLTVVGLIKSYLYRYIG